MLYPLGYDGSDQDTRVDEFVDLDTLIARRGPFQPEFECRIRAALVAAGGLVGIGGGWRSSELQRTTFLARHTQVASGGCCSWDGKRWALKAGMAHAAPPGSSFHESQSFANGTSGCAAIDLVGHDNTGSHSHAKAQQWMREHGGRFGLMTAWNWSVKEPWHVQMLELPRSCSTWKAEGRPNPTLWPLPGHEPKPDPLPPEDDMARLALARPRGFADAFVLLPATQELLRRLDVLGQPAVTIDVDPAELERHVGYELTPSKDGM